MDAKIFELSRKHRRPQRPPRILIVPVEIADECLELAGLVCADHTLVDAQRRQWRLSRLAPLDRAQYEVVHDARARWRAGTGPLRERDEVEDAREDLRREVRDWDEHVAVREHRKDETLRSAEGPDRLSQGLPHVPRAFGWWVGADSARTRGGKTRLRVRGMIECC